MMKRLKLGEFLSDGAGAELPLERVIAHPVLDGRQG
jgi:hypothetical protein